ncbi:MAG: hypothetical protein K0S30_757 [Clostridia bacterium]|nr:hypothetical protein [Clostridia bacterium]
MLCEKCKKNEATIYVSEITNGQKTGHYLCNDCIKLTENNIGTQAILFNDFISELMKIALEEGYLKSPKTPLPKKCPQCGLSLDEFLKIGKFGCNACYTTFDNELRNAFINVHGNIKHVGKAVQVDIQATDFSKGKQKQERLGRLEDALKKAIQEEAYEEAARLRDEIKAIKAGGED